jgi:DNA-binding transcriptional MocR family regulator
MSLRLWQAKSSRRLAPRLDCTTKTTKRISRGMQVVDGHGGMFVWAEIMPESLGIFGIVCH